MTGQELRRLRRRLGLSLADMGRALGYDGERATVARRLRRIETGQMEITDRAALAARFLARERGVNLDHIKAASQTKKRNSGSGL